METGGETEGTPRCLRERDDGEVRCSGACTGESPPDPLGGDRSAGPWQRKRAVGDEKFGQKLRHQDLCEEAYNTRGALQPRWRTGSPWLLDHCDEKYPQ